jgi:hypothetical protein
MATLTSIIINLDLNDASFRRGLEAAASEADGWTGRVGGVLTAGLAVGAAGAAAAIGGIWAGVSGASEAAAAMAQTEAAIESTGGAAGVTAQQIADMAGSFSLAEGKSLIPDDVIQSGQNVLLTFTGVGEQVFGDVTQAALDMNARLGGTLEGTFTQLGKAMNDPLTGMSALARSGVVFTDSQKEMIAQLQASGDIVGAQKIILAELNTEFGGSAQAAADASLGFAQIGEIGNGLLETIGGALLPGIRSLIDTLSTPANIEWLQGMATTIGGSLSSGLDWLVNTGLPGLMTGFTTVQTATAPLVALLGGWGSVLSGVGAVILGVIVVAFGAWAVAAGTAAIATIAATWPVLAVIAAIAVGVGLLMAAWTGNWGNIQGITAAAWATLEPILSMLWSWLSTTIPAAIATLVAFWTGTLYPALVMVGEWINANLIPFITALANVAFAALSVAATAAAGFWQNVLQPAFSAVGTFITGTLSPAFTTVANAISTTLQPAATWLGGYLPTISGGIDAISSAIQTATRWLGDLATSLSSLTLPDWLTPGSPTPLETAMWGLGDSFLHVAGQANGMGGAFGALPMPGVMGASPAGGMGGDMAGGGGVAAGAVADAVLTSNGRLEQRLVELNEKIATGNKQRDTNTRALRSLRANAGLS